MLLGRVTDPVPRGLVYPALAYAVLVLGFDTLVAMHVDWGIDFGRFSPYSKTFKLIAWFVLPFLLALPWLDFHYFTFRRWRRVDAALFVASCAAAGAAVLAIPHIDSLTQLYRGMGDAPPEAKWRFSIQFLQWVGFWLIGWEFLHRYFLLRPLMAAWPRWGWVLVPLAEGIYHLQKPLPEAAGMLAFGIVATLWTRHRKNLLLPLLAHFAVEMALLAFILTT